MKLAYDDSLYVLLSVLNISEFLENKRRFSASTLRDFTHHNVEPKVPHIHDQCLWKNNQKYRNVVQADAVHYQEKYDNYIASHGPGEDESHLEFEHRSDSFAQLQEATALGKEFPNPGGVRPAIAIKGIEYFSELII